MENIKEFVKTLPIIHDFGDWLEKIGDKRRRKQLTMNLLSVEKYIKWLIWQKYILLGMEGKMKIVIIWKPPHNRDTSYIR